MNICIFAQIDLEKMPSPSPQKIENLSEEEKNRIKSICLKRLFFRGGLYLALIIASVWIMIYFNTHLEKVTSEDNLGIINVAFIVIGSIGLSLLIGEGKKYFNETNASAKKILLTKIIDKKDGKIVLGNKAFSRNNILLDAPEFDALQKGDDVRLEISSQTNTLLSVTKI